MKAYCQWSVHPSDRHLLLSLVGGAGLGPKQWPQSLHPPRPPRRDRTVWVCTAVSQGICAILRKLLAFPPTGLRSNLLHVGPGKGQRPRKTPSGGFTWQSAHRSNMARATNPVTTALGHQVRANASWAGLQFTNQRRKALLQRAAEALNHVVRQRKDTGNGARPPKHWPPQLRHHSHRRPFARCLARTAYDEITGSAKDQPQTGLRSPPVARSHPNQT